jgi:hypothetical protein
MIPYTAFGIEPTRARTRIPTLFSYACLSARTFFVDDAFRSTVWWRSDVSGQTGA